MDGLRFDFIQNIGINDGGDGCLAGGTTEGLFGDFFFFFHFNVC